MDAQMRFLKSADGTRIAYTVVGGGPDVPAISVNSWWWTIDMIMAHPPERARFEALAQTRRVATFDRRGAGASERDPREWSFESHIADLGAVADRLDAPRVHLDAFGDAASIAAAYAAQNPERVGRLVLHSPTARGGGQTDSVVRLIRENWSWARRVFVSVAFPNGPIELQRWASDALQQGMSPEVAVKAVEMMASVDITELLTSVVAPTLVVEFGTDPEVRKVAGLIPEARLLAMPGDITSLWHDPEYKRAVKGFLDEDNTSSSKLPSGTAIILFADIADSAAITERLGDAAFRAKARDLDAALRAAIREHGGTPIEGKVLGDGVMAVFSSAREAIEGALVCATAGNDAGLPLHLGLHAGDVSREKDPDGRDNVYGGAVNIAARISGLSAAGEVLVSETVRSLARTSAGVQFEDRGEQSLKGVGEAVRVWAVRESE